MNRWVLRIQLNDEWEECYFATRHDALSAFAALAADYKTSLKGAVLFPCGEVPVGLTEGQHTPRRVYVN